MAKMASVLITIVVATYPAQPKESGQKRMKEWTAAAVCGAVNKEIRLSGRMEEERQTNEYVYGRERIRMNVALR